MVKFHWLTERSTYRQNTEIIDSSATLLKVNVHKHVRCSLIIKLNLTLHSRGRGFCLKPFPSLYPVSVVLDIIIIIFINAQKNNYTLHWAV